MPHLQPLDLRRPWTGAQPSKGIYPRTRVYPRTGVYPRTVACPCFQFRTIYAMSLYYVQKLLYQLNRDPHTQQRYREDFEGLLGEYELDDQERDALRNGDIGLLYVMGVNGQILMHYSALIGQEWYEYIQAMKDGVMKHGPVRGGLYTLLEERDR